MAAEQPAHAAPLPRTELPGRPNCRRGPREGIRRRERCRRAWREPHPVIAAAEATDHRDGAGSPCDSPVGWAVPGEPVVVAVVGAGTPADVLVVGRAAHRFRALTLARGTAPRALVGRWQRQRRPEVRLVAPHRARRPHRAPAPRRVGNALLVGHGSIMAPPRRPPAPTGHRWPTGRTTDEAATVADAPAPAERDELTRRRAQDIARVTAARMAVSTRWVRRVSPSSARSASASSSRVRSCPSDMSHAAISSIWSSL